MKEELLKALKENPELLKELLQENPELKNIIKQAIKTPKDKSLLSKLEKWGIKKEEVPKEYLENIQTIENFLKWLDGTLQSKTSGKKGLHLSLRPIKHIKEDQKDQENQEE